MRLAGVKKPVSSLTVVNIFYGSKWLQIGRALWKTMPFLAEQYPGGATPILFDTKEAREERRAMLKKADPQRRVKTELGEVKGTKGAGWAKLREFVANPKK